VRLGHGKLVDSMIWDGLWDIYNDFHMGKTGELVAKKYEITRREQDEFAARSHQRAGAATSAGKFDAEKFAVEIPQKKGEGPEVHDRRDGARRHDRGFDREAAPGVRSERVGDGGERQLDQRRLVGARGDEREKAKRWASSRWRACSATPPADARRNGS
jgi:hypothetical protein